MNILSGQLKSWLERDTDIFKFEIIDADEGSIDQTKPSFLISKRDRHIQVLNN